MSIEDARACVERMKSDMEFRAKVLAATEAAARTRAINAEGYACTAEEVDTLSAELTEADTDRVSGGMGVNRIIVTNG